MFKRIKKALARKASDSARSATMGVAAALFAAAGWIHANPEIVSQIVGDGWGGVAVAAGGLLVAVARLRTLGRDE